MALKFIIGPYGGGGGQYLLLGSLLEESVNKNELGN